MNDKLYILRIVRQIMGAEGLHRHATEDVSDRGHGVGQAAQGRGGLNFIVDYNNYRCILRQLYAYHEFSFDSTKNLSILLGEGKVL